MTAQLIIKMFKHHIIAGKMLSVLCQFVIQLVSMIIMFKVWWVKYIERDNADMRPQYRMLWPLSHLPRLGDRQPFTHSSHESEFGSDLLICTFTAKGRRAVLIKTKELVVHKHP